MTESKRVAGTIMVTNQQGETFFLVKDNDGVSSFIYERIEETEKLPMGIIMETLLEFVTVNSESIRLMDLTNIKVQDKTSPLFVFDLVERPEDEMTLLNQSGLVTWRRTKDLTELLSECDSNVVLTYKS